MLKMSPILSQDCQLTIVHGSWLDNACDTCAIIFVGDEYCVCPILGLASRVAAEVVAAQQFLLFHCRLHSNFPCDIIQDRQT